MNDDASDNSLAAKQGGDEELTETSNLGGSGGLIRTVMFPFSVKKLGPVCQRGPRQRARVGFRVVIVACLSKSGKINSRACIYFVETSDDRGVDEMPSSV